MGHHCIYFYLLKQYGKNILLSIRIRSILPTFETYKLLTISGGLWLWLDILDV